MTGHRHFRILMLSALALSVSAAPSSGNELPLQQGRYVQENVPCEAANNSNSLTILPGQINSAHVAGHIEGVSGDDGIYQVTLALEGDAGMGGERREVVEWTLTVTDPATVAIENEFAASTYRLCSPSADEGEPQQASLSSDAAPFMGAWSYEASCPAHETKTYGPDSMESEHAFCPYEEYAEVAPGQWNVRASCGFEGQGAPVTFELHVSGDRLREITVSPDGHRQELALMRCERH